MLTGPTLLLTVSLVDEAGDEIDAQPVRFYLRETTRQTTCYRAFTPPVFAPGRRCTVAGIEGRFPPPIQLVIRFPDPWNLPVRLKKRQTITLEHLEFRLERG